jgi:hypothetical protein
MQRTIVFLFACMVLSGCDQSPSKTGNASSTSAGSTTSSTQTIQASADSPTEEVASNELSDANVIAATARQVASAGYPCDSVAHLWKLDFTKNVGMTILKVRCSSGADYQLTLFDNKEFTKPWTGVLMGK